MTTKKRISRVFAVALAIVLMMALALPTFAVEAKSSIIPRTPIITTALYNKGYQAYMNCAGNDAFNYNNRDVNLCYRITGGDQAWNFDSTTGGYYIKSGTSDAGGNVYALNIYGYRDKHYLNCDVMKLLGNERDAKVKYISLSEYMLDYNATFALQNSYYSQYYLGVKVDPDNKAPYGKTVCWMTGTPSTTTALQWVHSH